MILFGSLLKFLYCCLADLNNVNTEWEKYVSTLEEEKDNALSSLETTRAQLVDAESKSQNIHEESIRGRKQLEEQVLRMEGEITKLLEEKSALESLLADTKEELDRNQQLLLQGDHNNTLNDMEIKLHEASEKYEGNLKIDLFSFSNFYSVVN